MPLIARFCLLSLCLTAPGPGFASANEAGPSPASTTAAPPPSSLSPPPAHPSMPREPTHPDPLDTDVIDDSDPLVRCLEDFATPLGGTGVFSRDSKQFYHFSKLGKIRHNGTTPTPYFRYSLQIVDLMTLKAQQLVAIKAPEVAAILPQGEPINGAIAVMQVHSSGEACVRGPGRYIAFPLQKGIAKNASKLVEGEGKLQVIEGPKHALLYDTSKKSIIEFDFDKMQSRSRIVRLHKREILLYADLVRRHQYAWQMATKLDPNRGLVAYDGTNSVAGGMKYESSHRVLQQQRLFGAAETDARSNRLRIIELPRWSGVQQPKTYEIFPPTSNPISEAQIAVHFEKKLALIAPSTREVSLRWDGVLIFDYAKSWLLASYKSPSNRYVAHSEISPDGNFILLELANRQTHETASLRAFSVQTRKWTDIALAGLKRARLPKPE